MSKGRFVWYDLMTTDVDGAREFYTELLGYGTQQWSGDDTPYTMWTIGEQPIGGVMLLPDEAKAQGAPPHWLAYVESSDVDATAAQTSELGGAVLHPPTDIPQVGRFAVLQDPQGAVFAAFSPLESMPDREGDPRVGEVSWHELLTSDLAAGFEFYQKLFGWNKHDAMDMGELGTYQLYGVGESTLGGMMNIPPGMEAPPNWMLYHFVKDVEATMDQVAQLGGKVLHGPQEVPGGDVIAHCMDPQGAAFALHGPAKEAE